MLFDDTQSPRVFGTAPGVPLAEVLADRILADMARHPPEAMAKVRLYLNTGRTERSVRNAFEARLTGFLPRLYRIADLGDLPWPGLARPASDLARTLELAGLVARLADREPALASGTAIYDLSKSLSGLLREMREEGVGIDDIDRPDLAEGHAEHWEKTLSFVRIAARFTAADAVPDAAGRLRMIVEAMISEWSQKPPTDPVIVAGSTGSRGTTSLFMAAVAALPQGAVILPGFDFHMSADQWESLAAGPVPHEDHPQYRYARFLSQIGLSPAAVRPWTDAPPPDSRRNRVVSLALATAPTTDRWIVEGPSLGDLEAATSGIELIEAPSPRVEAEAVALCIRSAVEEGRSVTLVTPDRTLARRVTESLLRWRIVPDDSAGEPLSQTATGRLLRHGAAALARRLTAADLVVLLKHPLAATGGDDRGPHALMVRRFEVWLRKEGPAFPTPADIAQWANEDPERAAWAAWVGSVLTLAEGPARRPLPDWASALAEFCTRVSDGPGGSQGRLWEGPVGAQAAEKLSALQAAPPNAPSFTAAGFQSLLDSYLAEEEAREAPVVTDERVKILGPMELRAHSSDIVIAAGLNEGVWPAQPSPDPWLSRDMRRKAGLLSPERQIGLSAHDVQLAAAAPALVLSRSLRDDTAETVPSRWLARLLNLLRGLPDQGGATAVKAMSQRGQKWLALVEALHRTSPVPPAHRPAPRPPVSARPRRLSVTAVRTLYRDPYAVYAERILYLSPLHPLRAEPDARDRGNVMHKIMEEFAKRDPGGDPAAAAAALLNVADDILRREAAWPTARRFWRANVAAFALPFSAEEIARRAAGSPVLLERTGSIPVAEVDFVLRAKADRIDRLRDGTLHIFDYKTGSLPAKVDFNRFEVQLLLEGAMAERGAFEEIGAATVSRLTYLKLSTGLETRDVDLDPGRLDATWDRLIALIRRYDRPETAYPARGKLPEMRIKGDFDHLSRLGEWGLHDPAVPEDLA